MPSTLSVAGVKIRPSATHGRNGALELMSRVYSTLFARGIAPVGSVVVVYTVPAARRSVLKSIQITPAGATPSSLYIRVNGAVTLMQLPLAAGQGGNVWNGMVVFNAGDTIEVSSITNAVQYFFSGFELTVP